MASPRGSKKLKKMPHLFSQILELPLPPDFPVDCFESDSAFEFVARGAFKGVSATEDGEEKLVIAEVVDIAPGGAKKVVVHEFNPKRTPRSAEDEKGPQRSAQDNDEEEEQNEKRTRRSTPDEEEHEEEEEEEEKWRFRLPQTANPDAATARFENGILRVLIPKLNNLCAVSSTDQSQTRVLPPLLSSTPEKNPGCCAFRAISVF